MADRETAVHQRRLGGGRDSCEQIAANSMTPLASRIGPRVVDDLWAALGHVETCSANLEARAGVGREWRRNGVLFYIAHCGRPAEDFTPNPGRKSVGLCAAGTISGTIAEIWQGSVIRPSP